MSRNDQVHGLQASHDCISNIVISLFLQLQVKHFDYSKASTYLPTYSHPGGTTVVLEHHQQDMSFLYLLWSALCLGTKLKMEFASLQNCYSE